MTGKLTAPRTIASAITLARPQTPPFPEQIEIIDPTDPTRSRKIQAWSYGGYLLNETFARVDWDLRHMVAQCLCDKPAHRPRLHDLLEAVDRRIRAGNWGRGGEDERIRQWVQQCFLDPPPPLVGVAPHAIDVDGE